jgi:TrmH family RNA methyltransferase
MLAMRRAVEGLRLKPVKVLVDGNRLPKLDVLAEAIVGGDAKVKSISAASILAKVHARPPVRSCTSGVPAVRLCRAQGLQHARAPGGAARARRLRAPPPAFRPVAASSRRQRRRPGMPCRCSDRHDPVRSHHSRDNALLKDLRKLAQDNTGAYRKQGRVWLEGDHLCRAALQRGVQPAMRCSRPRPSGTGARVEWTGRGKTVSWSDASLFGISGLESPAPHGLRAARCRPAPKCRPMRPPCARPAAGRRQRGTILRSAGGLRLPAGAGAEGHGRAVGAQGAARRHGRAFRPAADRRCGIRRPLDALQVPLLATSSHQGEWLHQAQLPHGLAPG